MEGAHMTRTDLGDVEHTNDPDFQEFAEELAYVTDEDGQIQRQKLELFLETILPESDCSRVIDRLFPDDEPSIDIYAVFSIFREMEPVGDDDDPGAISEAALSPGHRSSSSTLSLSVVGRSRRQSVASRSAVLTDKMDALYKEVSELRGDRDALADALDNIEEDNGRAAGYKTRLDGMARTLDAVTTELDETRQAQAAAEEENEALRQALDASQRDSEALRRQLDAVTTIRELREKVDSATGDVARLEAQNELFEQQRLALLDLQEGVVAAVNRELMRLEDSSLLVDRIHSVLSEAEGANWNTFGGVTSPVFDPRLQLASLHVSPATPGRSSGRPRRASQVFSRIARDHEPGRGSRQSDPMLPVTTHRLRDDVCVDEIVGTTMRVTKAEASLEGIMDHLSRIQRQLDEVTATVREGMPPTPARTSFAVTIAVVAVAIVAAVALLYTLLRAIL
ncbi:Chromosome partition protein Smc [Carpediemonas membranifera]|uniref:Chromosome partition protein Smc n=1 Tax=Carpediemonas membranifera TaxID=201153 RepID=A0A8J6B025_9EUKA|nr:Chromosome partition protein Smc [Carpediemonas membranifera]|eukprot:KAG9395535.1 Chromosome partition protein Smc [Carpediemonas membranifera]